MELKTSVKDPWKWSDLESIHVLNAPRPQANPKLGKSGKELGERVREEPAEGSE